MTDLGEANDFPDGAIGLQAIAKSPATVAISSRGVTIRCWVRENPSRRSRLGGGSSRTLGRSSNPAARTRNWTPCLRDWMVDRRDRIFGPRVRLSGRRDRADGKAVSKPVRRYGGTVKTKLSSTIQ
jgi:hypothetical protein